MKENRRRTFTPVEDIAELEVRGCGDGEPQGETRVTAQFAKYKEVSVAR